MEIDEVNYLPEKNFDEVFISLRNEVTIHAGSQKIGGQLHGLENNAVESITSGLKFTTFAARVPPRDDLPPMTVETLHNLTSMVGNTDIAQKVAQEYFNENVLYVLDGTKRKELLGMEKQPTLNKERLKIINGVPNDILWYGSFIKSWLPSVLANDKEVKEGGKFKVNEKIIEADMSNECSKIPYLRQTKLLYHYAYVEKVDGFSDYLRDAARWTKEYSEFLVSEDQIEGWVALCKTAPALASIMYKQISSKLDLLDPTTKTSREVLMKLNMAVIIDEIYTNIDYISKKAIFDAALNKIFRDILESTEIADAKEVLQSIMSCLKEGTQLVPVLLGAFSGLGKDLIKWPDRVGTTLWEKLKENFKLDYLQRFFSKENTIILAKRLLSTVFLAAGAVSFIFGALYVDQMDIIEKIQFGFNTAGFVALLLVSVSEKTGNFLNKFIMRSSIWMQASLSPRFAAGTLRNIRGFFKSVFTGSLSGLIERRIMPFLTLVFATQLVRDLISDVKDGNIGAIVMDSLALIATIGEAVLLFSSVSWAGGLGVVLAILSVAFLLIKFFFFPPKTPLEKYYDTLPARYKLKDIELVEPQSIAERNDLKIMAPSKYHLKYLSPHNDHKLHVDQYSYERNPFKVTRIGKSQVTISNAFNYDRRITTLPSYLYVASNGKLVMQQSSVSSTINQIWYLVNSHVVDSFNLLAFTGKFLYIDGDGNIGLTDNKKDAAAIKLQGVRSWFDPSSTWSLPSPMKLRKGQVIVNDHAAYGLADTGLHCINYSKYAPHLKENNQDYIKSNSTNQLIHVDPLKHLEYLTIDEHGKIAIRDKQGNSITYTAPGIQLTPIPKPVAPFSMVFSRNPQEIWFAVVDSNYQELLHRTK
ncbi:hypothetical protein DLAC_00222 [Tieghemostelium lacteum]|uniref:Uncharacterized protein n=1 Tax=Tieghemostelium lacteum TaxID=361077 RepID=A0A152A959_TIELA|nr:hypothetical protein DLAC_00222 [Tieghemostelium lacteum]|eukprot:KYR02759.1 hypothetical protein DLAC_00222 [Tieghemostelium lacteum]